MKKIVLFTALVLALTACSKKERFSVNGELKEKIYNGKSVLFRKSENGQVTDDTVKIAKSAFQYKGSIENPEVRIVLLPETGLGSFMVVLEKGAIAVSISKDSIVVGGTPLNEKLQARNRQNQEIVDRIQASDAAYEAKSASGTITPADEEAYQKEHQALLVENTEYIIAFVKENIQNPLGKYFFMKYYLSFPPERKEEMMSFATDELKEMYRRKE